MKPREYRITITAVDTKQSQEIPCDASNSVGPNSPIRIYADRDHVAVEYGVEPDRMRQLLYFPPPNPTTGRLLWYCECYQDSGVLTSGIHTMDVTKCSKCGALKPSVIA